MLANINLVGDALLPACLGARLQRTDDFVRRRGIMYADIAAYENKDAESRAALARLSRARELPGRRVRSEPEGGAGLPAAARGARPREMARCLLFRARRLRRRENVRAVARKRRNFRTPSSGGSFARIQAGAKRGVLKRHARRP